MTREEQAFEASKRFEESLTEQDLATLSKDDMCFAFQLGVKWAESHPESPWISVEDNLASTIITRLNFITVLVNAKHLWYSITYIHNCFVFSCL